MTRAATGERRGISGRNHYSLDSRFENSLGARWGLSEMIAWLECDVHRRASCPIAGGFESKCFSVRLTVAGVISLAYNGVTANDNSADHWVRRCLTPALLGEGKRATHVLCVARIARTRIVLRPIRRFENRLLACH